MTKPFELSTPQSPPNGIVVTPSSDALPDGYGSQLGQFLALDYTAPIGKANGTYERDGDGNYNPSSSKIAGNVVLDDQAYVKTGVDALEGGNCYWQKKGSKAVLSWSGPYGFHRPQFSISSIGVPTVDGYTSVLEKIATNGSFTVNVYSFNRYDSFVYIHGLKIDTGYDKLFGAGIVEGMVVCLVSHPTLKFGRVLIKTDNILADFVQWDFISNVFISAAGGESVMSSSGVAVFSEDGLNIIQITELVYNDGAAGVLTGEHPTKRGVLRISLSIALGVISVDTNTHSSFDDIFFSDSTPPTNTIVEAAGFIDNDELLITSDVAQYTFSTDITTTVAPQFISIIEDNVTVVQHKAGAVLLAETKSISHFDNNVSRETITPPEPDPAYFKDSFSGDQENFSDGYIFMFVDCLSGKIIFHQSLRSEPRVTVSWTVTTDTNPATQIPDPLPNITFIRQNKVIEFSRNTPELISSAYTQRDIHTLEDLNQQLEPVFFFAGFSFPISVDSSFVSSIRTAPFFMPFEFTINHLRFMFVVSERGILLGIIEATKVPPDLVDPIEFVPIIPSANSLDSLFGMSGDGATLINDLDVKNAIFRM